SLLRLPQLHPSQGILPMDHRGEEGRDPNSPPRKSHRNDAPGNQDPGLRTSRQKSFANSSSLKAFRCPPPVSCPLHASMKHKLTALTAAIALTLCAFPAAPPNLAAQSTTATPDLETRRKALNGLFAQIWEDRL